MANGDKAKQCRQAATSVQGPIHCPAIAEKNGERNRESAHARERARGREGGAEGKEADRWTDRQRRERETRCLEGSAGVRINRVADRLPRTSRCEPAGLLPRASSRLAHIHRLFVGAWRA